MSESSPRIFCHNPTPWGQETISRALQRAFNNTLSRQVFRNVPPEDIFTTVQ